MNKEVSALVRFRWIAIIEGISYLLLLFIAMPLKYFADQPLPVKYMGWLHGVLFVAFCMLLLMVWIRSKWSFGKATLAFISSLFPFGTFFFDKELKKDLERASMTELS